MTEECYAKNLKQCPSCHNVIKSECSKIACSKDGSKPTMILPNIFKPSKRKKCSAEDSCRCK